MTPLSRSESSSRCDLVQKCNDSGQEGIFELKLSVCRYRIAQWCTQMEVKLEECPVQSIPAGSENLPLIVVRVLCGRGDQTVLIAE